MAASLCARQFTAFVGWLSVFHHKFLSHDFTSKSTVKIHLGPPQSCVFRQQRTPCFIDERQFNAWQSRETKCIGTREGNKKSTERERGVMVESTLFLALACLSALV